MNLILCIWLLKKKFSIEPPPCGWIIDDKSLSCFTSTHSSCAHSLFFGASEFAQLRYFAHRKKNLFHAGFFSFSCRTQSNCILFYLFIYSNVYFDFIHYCSIYKCCGVEKCLHIRCTKKTTISNIHTYKQHNSRKCKYTRRNIRNLHKTNKDKINVD